MDIKRILVLSGRLHKIENERKDIEKEFKKLCKSDFETIRKTGDINLINDYLNYMTDLSRTKRYLFSAMRQYQENKGEPNND